MEEAIKDHLGFSREPPTAASPVRLDVMNVVGQSLHHVDLVPSGADWQTQIELAPGLPNGHYMLRVVTGDGSMNAVLPFVLNR